MPSLYIIAGCNGAGKTTASYTILPEILNCVEFVNADSIAAGLSPFNVDSVAFEAGRIMLHRVYALMAEKVDFALETTLSTRSYVSLINHAHKSGYKITLLYFWLNSPKIAIERVAKRVSKGGHHIPKDVIERRYFRGLKNLINLYIPICDNWIVIDNMDISTDIIARGKKEIDITIENSDIWELIKLSK
jgi:predicted ABC-type ATPase